LNEGRTSRFALVPVSDSANLRASSSGVIARLLGNLRRPGNRETPAVLSVLMVEDFAMDACLPLLAVVTSGGTWWQALLAVVAAMAAIAAAITASWRWGHHVGRILGHPDAGPVPLRVLGITLIAAALAEIIHVSGGVGAFLIGLALTGAAADRARAVLSPLHDLFALVFFLALDLSVDPGDLLTMLPAASALVVFTAATKPASIARARAAVAGCGPERRSSPAASSPSSPSAWLPRAGPPGGPRGMRPRPHSLRAHPAPGPPPVHSVNPAAGRGQ
jgi:Kef-type K+ transport system membrane component KefB